jgi:hypothetical protein
MRVPDEVRKAVGFIGYEDKRNNEFVPIGSFFFLGHDPTDGGTVSPKVYAVTARHVIENLKAKGCEDATLRLNPKDPKASLITSAISLAKWFLHPSDESIDVAITEMGVPATSDHMVIPINLCAMPNVFHQNEIALGEEVFVSGLFRHHYGNQRNIPIVRVGSLAALDEENISSSSFANKMEGYLIEVRSTSGLSGSPVFLNLGSVRALSGQIRYLTGGEVAKIFLLGLVHGHFVSEPHLTNEQQPTSPKKIIEQINAGIAIVVPVKNILAVISAFEKQATNGNSASASYEPFTADQRTSPRATCEAKVRPINSAQNLRRGIALRARRDFGGTGVGVAASLLPQARRCADARAIKQSRRDLTTNKHCAAK